MDSQKYNKRNFKSNHRCFYREGNGRTKPYKCVYPGYNCKYWLSCKEHYKEITFEFNPDKLVEDWYKKQGLID